MGGLYGSPELGPYAEPRQQIKTIKKKVINHKKIYGFG